MSTRCQIALFDQHSDPMQPILFYRHSDGYPEGVGNTLNTFCSWVKEPRIRNNNEQASGWLIVLGYHEYAYPSKWNTFDVTTPLGECIPPEEDNHGMGWKVGAYEPCPSNNWHADIEYIHLVDVKRGEWMSIDVWDTWGSLWGTPKETTQERVATIIKEIQRTGITQEMRDIYLKPEDD